MLKRRRLEAEEECRNLRNIEDGIEGRKKKRRRGKIMKGRGGENMIMKRRREKKKNKNLEEFQKEERQRRMENDIKQHNENAKITIFHYLSLWFHSVNVLQGVDNLGPGLLSCNWKLFFLWTQSIQCLITSCPKVCLQ